MRCPSVEMVCALNLWRNTATGNCGGCEVLFSPGLSVCVCVCVSVCPANIWIFYFSATRRDIDLKLIPDTYRVVLDSLKKIDLHMSKVKVTSQGRYIAF